MEGDCSKRLGEILHNIADLMRYAWQLSTVKYLMLELLFFTYIIIKP